MWAEDATGAESNPVGSSVGQEIRGVCFRGSRKRVTVEGATEVWGGYVFLLRWRKSKYASSQREKEPVRRRSNRRFKKKRK